MYFRCRLAHPDYGVVGQWDKIAVGERRPTKPTSAAYARFDRFCPLRVLARRLTCLTGRN